MGRLKSVHEMTDEELSVLHDMCPRCDAELDTGWECNRCKFDARPIALMIGRDLNEKMH
jgi:ribosomal protein S27AE